MNFFKKIFDHEYKELEKFKVLANEVMALEDDMSKLKDKDFKARTEEFIKRLENGETLDDILVEAYALVREAAYRVLGEKAYYTQILGGIAIHNGNVAELKTGEGKTLVTTFPAYLNALTKKGVHVVTVNEYLTRRNAEWMGPVYELLGLTVGINSRELSPKEKQDAYNCDITYTTNNEVGFDYLRDNMVVNAKDRVQRGLNYAIIDEVDSALIDEARTPLIISGGSLQSANYYIQADKFVKSLKENAGYNFDEKTLSVTLDTEGIAAAEKAFAVKNLFDIENTNLVHYINQALRANYAMKRDFDYVVQDDKILIVDQFTGRLMPGRAYSDGLHQAIEAKEGVTINQETKTVATITFQNLFRMYDKLSGMTGTAKTEEEEFRDIYNMYVIQIPTNKPVARKDYGDLLFATKEGKYKAIIEEIKERHAAGQPVLVGTIAVETSELISEKLKKAHIPHEVLNAKNNEREAEIIAKAGEKGAVTIATNMAGRGTDIKLGEGVRELGGLAVIGTERHESRRIDNQLRGRSGRQGDPGFSQFCVSFEDDLMVRFGTDRAKNLLRSIGFNDDMSIRNKMLSASIESAQKRVEGNNYDTRKTILEYDNVINKQREIIYEKRNEILDSESIHNTVLNNFRGCVSWLVESHLMEDDTINDKDKEEILEFANQYLVKKPLDIIDLKDKTYEEMIDYIYDKVVYEYDKKLEKLPEDVTNEYEKAISLRVIDTYWTEHINTMALLRESIGLRGYAQESPVQAYTKEGYDLFDRLLNTIEQQTTVYLLNAEIRQNIERKKVNKNEKTNESDTTAKKQPKKVNKIGRNEPCPCGSGKKYKQCCGK
ncbi:MAG: preprotein translocase subunit SecA [Bacillales bacterium]|nr:preprotein translocase subunit SecA [Bacillales bacterium]